MKQGHIAIIFMIFYMACCLLLFLEQEKYDAVIKEKQRIEHAFLNAIENTGREYEKVLFETDEKQQQFFVNSFFEALYIFAEIFEQKEKQQSIMMYVPLLVLVEEDGAFFNYISEKQDENNAMLIRIWSEKIKFEYPAVCTEVQKKAIVAAVLEEITSYIISNHNYIASQYGLSYQFTAPDFLGNMEELPEFPMLFVVFQGWPLNASGNITYENCMDAAVFLQRVQEKVSIPDGIPYSEMQ